MSSWQCPLLALSVHGPQMVGECVCVCLNVRWGCGCVHVDGMNLKYVVHWHIHISSFRTMSVLYTSQHTQMHPKKTPFEDSEPTELKVDTATFTCLCGKCFALEQHVHQVVRVKGGCNMLHCECHVNGSGDSFLTETKYSASGQHVLLTFFSRPQCQF